MTLETLIHLKARTGIAALAFAAYNAELYWTRVAQEIEKRGDINFVAGDDNPYYRYKRQKFLRRFLDTIIFDGKTALEVGFGPGGNLRHLATTQHPKMLYGADISQKMHDLASRNLRSFNNIRLAKTDGMHLPFVDQSIDISFTVTVLQHVTDGDMLKALIKDISRVTRESIVVMEDIGSHPLLGGQGAGVNRTVDTYKGAFAAHGFQLQNTDFLNTQISRRWYALAWLVYRRLFHQEHQEGDAIKPIGKAMIGLPLIATRFFDDAFGEKMNLAKLTFSR
jgi:ubiquinone/menaquinone biosynthesis C-methylase UbiE